MAILHTCNIGSHKVYIYIMVNFIISRIVKMLLIPVITELLDKSTTWLNQKVKDLDK